MIFYFPILGAFDRPITEIHDTIPWLEFPSLFSWVNERWIKAFTHDPLEEGGASSTWNWVPTQSNFAHINKNHNFSYIRSRKPIKFTMGRFEDVQRLEFKKRVFWRIECILQLSTMFNSIDSIYLMDRDTLYNKIKI